jgi:hypothetical protein
VDLIGAQFPAFDCESAVIFPFQDDTARDEAFQKGMLIFSTFHLMPHIHLVVLWRIGAC